MTERAFLLETAVGPIGIIVTEPGGDPRAAAIVLHGAAGSRAGINRLWARLVRALAGLGIVVVRLDYPGLGSSLGTRVTGARRYDEPADHVAVRAVVDWMRRRHPGLDLVGIGACYGGRVASRLAATHPLAGLALVGPALHIFPGPPPSGRVARIRASLRTRLQARGWGRSSRPVGGDMQRSDPLVAADVGAAAGRMPTWLVMGDEDPWAPLLPEFRTQLGAGASRLWLEIVPGMELQGHRTYEIQQFIIERVVGWAEQVLGTDEPEPAKVEINQ